MHAKGHHAYEEQPGAVAKRLAGPSPRQRWRRCAARAYWLGPNAAQGPDRAAGMDRVRKAETHRLRRHAGRFRQGRPWSRSARPAPCDFVSANGVDALALQRYRKANAQYRLGSPHGSKGELASLP